MFSFIYQKKFQRILIQFIFALFILFILFYLYNNMIKALASRDLLPSFYFLNLSSGFDIGEKLIEYDRTSSYGRALLVGILNTLTVSFIGIIFTTLLGVVIGVFRLSSHVLLSSIARVFIAITRNIPLLVLLIFLKTALFNQLPRVQEAITFPGKVYLSNRGFVFPWLSPTPFTALYFWILIPLFLFSLLLTYYLYKRCKHPIIWGVISFLSLSIILILLFPFSPFTLSIPTLNGFNFSGGVHLTPEFLAILTGLVLYHAAYIAEIVRSGIQSISKGQRETSLALGLSSFQTLKQVIFPQAIQVIIPPMISVYLNLIKNSSLAAYIGYPDLFSIAGTIFNQTGRSIEVIFLIMITYLLFSLITSLILNIYNRKIRRGVH
jgi:general L-amino acid transport system permease protein